MWLDVLVIPHEHKHLAYPNEYIKIRTATPTPTRPIEIDQREDPDLRKGLGSIYKPI